MCILHVSFSLQNRKSLKLIYVYTFPYSVKPANICLTFCREKVPSEENQREEASHERVHRQTAAVLHLENGERLLRIRSGAVPVRQGPCRQRKGR